MFAVCMQPSYQKIQILTGKAQDKSNPAVPDNCTLVATLTRPQTFGVEANQAAAVLRQSLRQNRVAQVNHVDANSVRQRSTLAEQQCFL